MDGRTDKIAKTIAVTLRLCFAARVNNPRYYILLTDIYMFKN